MRITRKSLAKNQPSQTFPQVPSPIADATNAVDASDVGDAFAEIERQDMMVAKVIIGPRAYIDLKKKGIMDDEDSKDIRLWGAKVKLVHDGLLVVWDETKAPRKKR